MGGLGLVIQWWYCLVQRRNQYTRDSCIQENDNDKVVTKGRDIDSHTTTTFCRTAKWKVGKVDTKMLNKPKGKRLTWKETWIDINQVFGEGRAGVRATMKYIRLTQCGTVRNSVSRGKISSRATMRDRSFDVESDLRMVSKRAMTSSIVGRVTGSSAVMSATRFSMNSSPRFVCAEKRYIQLAISRISLKWN